MTKARKTNVTEAAPKEVASDSQPWIDDKAASPRNRATRSNGRATRLAMRDAAVDLFYDHGYQNVSLRLLASKIGLQAGSLYNHISTKQDLLFVLLRDIMTEILETTRAHIARSDGVIEELAAFIECHLAFHTSRLKEVYIGNSELRNLEPDNRKVVVALRKEYFDIISDIIDRGVEQRLFVAVNSQISARVVMGTLNGVAGWYRANGEASVAELTYIYTTMIFRALGAPVAAIQAAAETLATSVAESALAAKPHGFQREPRVRSE